MAKYKMYHTLAALGLAGVVPLPAHATLPASPVNDNVVMMKPVLTSGLNSLGPGPPGFSVRQDGRASARRRERRSQGVGLPCAQGASYQASPPAYKGRRAILGFSETIPLLHGNPSVESIHQGCGCPPAPRGLTAGTPIMRVKLISHAGLVIVVLVSAGRVVAACEREDPLCEGPL
jgi:hypothetical protein